MLREVKITLQKWSSNLGSFMKRFEEVQASLNKVEMEWDQDFYNDSLEDSMKLARR